LCWINCRSLAGWLTREDTKTNAAGRRARNTFVLKGTDLTNRARCDAKYKYEGYYKVQRKLDNVMHVLGS